MKYKHEYKLNDINIILHRGYWEGGEGSEGLIQNNHDSDWSMCFFPPEFPSRHAYPPPPTHTHTIKTLTHTTKHTHHTHTYIYAHTHSYTHTPTHCGPDGSMPAQQVMHINFAFLTHVITFIRKKRSDTIQTRWTIKTKSSMTNKGTATTKALLYTKQRILPSRVITQKTV